MENVFNSELVDNDNYEILINRVNNNIASKEDKYKIEKYIHYSRWCLESNISLKDFKKYYHKLGILKHYRIYENINNFKKILEILNIQDNDTDIYEKYNSRLPDIKDVKKLYDDKIAKLKNEYDNTKDNKRKKILEKEGFQDSEIIDSPT